MLTAVLSLSGALVFGAADFLGGLAARRVNAMLATAVAAVTGFAILLVAAPFLGGAWTPHDALWGAFSGVASAVAISLLYAALAIGPMSILSPLTAVVAAVAPMLFQTSDESGVVPLVLNRGFSAAILFAVLGVLALAGAQRRQAAASETEGMPRASLGASIAPPRTDAPGGLRLAVACGVVDVAASVLLLLGIRAGDLSVAAVLGAMYPAGTILLAALVLREHVAPVQWVGLTLALAAAAMLALA
ncbi:EamA family transporter [Agromyces bauzanensis]|uniref:Multidrug transporter n=1 Tax=Agromyces bauzanensis TaxID=1308924 RepID=A0A917UUI9_9MICO|nr:EamA family transporter [Agromyces bauzanensis]GGJ86435.1 multidrug transporter [Agromyces bauzanensis]